MTLADLTTPVESDYKSVTSTIPTKNQLKPSKIDQVRLFQDNTGFHLVSSSNNTQPKISSNTHAPTHPSQYPHLVIPRDLPGQYYQEGHNQPTIKIPDNNNTVNKPAQIPNDNDNNNDDSEEDDDSVWIFDDMDEVEIVPAQGLATNTTRTLGDDSADDEEILPIPDVKLNPKVLVSTTNSMTENPIKVKPTTTPTPTWVSNTHACLGNNNDKDDDDDDNSSEMPPVLIEICTLQNTKTNNIPAIKPQQISNGPDDDDVYAAPLDVGTINNKNMPKMDLWDDDASQVTVAT